MKTPLNYTGIKFWLPSSSRKQMWKGAIGSSDNPIIDDPIRSIETKTGGLVLNASDDDKRPFLRADGTRNGSVHFTLATTQRYMDVISSTSYFNFLHEGSDASILFWIKFNVGIPQLK